MRIEINTSESQRKKTPKRVLERPNTVRRNSKYEDHRHGRKDSIPGKQLVSSLETANRTGAAQFSTAKLWLKSGTIPKIL